MQKGHGFGTWNVRSLYRSGSLTAAARELVKYKFNLVDIQEVRRDKVLRGCLCNIIVLNVHAPSKEKSNGS
jgi:hypothetical protein